jgi:hypothetical protein
LDAELISGILIYISQDVFFPEFSGKHAIFCPYSSKVDLYSQHFVFFFSFPHDILSGQIYLDTPNLEFHPMPPSKYQKKRALQRGPGRPSQGIRSGYARLDVYVSTSVCEALNRLADRQTQHAGQAVTRTDVIRAALEAYIREHLPEARI